MQDIIPTILSHLPIPNILTASTINKLFHQSYKSNTIWKLQLSKTFNTNILKKSNAYKTFKHLYLSTRLAKQFKNDYAHITIDNIHTITELRKAHYNINHLPPSITKFKSLQTLILMHQHNPYIPAQIKKLQTLEKLILVDCQLKTVTVQVFQLTNLKILDISHNNIQTLPPTIGNLINLKSLVIHNNYFETLPPEIENLSNLTDLNYGNRNQRMQSLKNFTNLQTLTIHHMDVTINEINIPSLATIKLQHIKSFIIPKDFISNSDIKITF